ncbi:hypothetical protein TNCV_3111031 [Trichonephila clavipes]|nr:hypothetical protein TNCV_3111031 [Trichonephila clavipes]
MAEKSNGVVKMVLDIFILLKSLVRCMAMVVEITRMQLKSGMKCWTGGEFPSGYCITIFKVKSKVYERHRSFKEGRESTEYDERVGRPSFSSNAKNIVLVSECVRKV